MRPQNYDINYYNGDDFTIMVFPKDSTGAAIDIGNATGFFHVGSSRGNSPDWKGVGTVSIDRAYNNGPYGLLCTLDNAVGVNIRNGYVYDIGYILKGRRITLLTGRFIVTERVEPSGATP